MELKHYGVKGMRWGYRKDGGNFNKDMSFKKYDTIASTTSDPQVDIYDEKDGSGEVRQKLITTNIVTATRNLKIAGLDTQLKIKKSMNKTNVSTKKLLKTVGKMGYDGLYESDGNILTNRKSKVISGRYSKTAKNMGMHTSNYDEAISINNKKSSSTLAREAAKRAQESYRKNNPYKW